MINVNLLQGRSVEVKRKYVTELTKLTCECLDVSPDTVRVVFTEMHPENLGVAGVLAIDRKK